MPSGGTKFEASRTVSANTRALADDFNQDFTDVEKHLNTDVSLGWFAIVDSDNNSQGLEFVSASAPTFKVQTSSQVNITDIISKGMKIRVEQSTGGTKYGTIVTSPTVNGSSKTEFEILTTDTIENEAINNPKFSSSDNPHGWDQPKLKFQVEVDNNQTLSDNTTTVVDWDNTLYDQYGVFSLTNDEFTAPHDGLYEFTFFASLGDASGNITKGRLSIYKNGSQVARVQLHSDSSAEFFDLNPAGISREFSLVSGDKIDFRVLADVTGADDSSSTIFGGGFRTYVYGQLTDLYG